jgi:hypothetical protein
MNALFFAAMLSAAFAGSQVISEDIDLPPRPEWSRPFISLDGLWDFDFDPGDAGVNEKWFENHSFAQKIKVPFPWQSELSGIHDVNYQGAAWCQRQISIPAGVVGKRAFLVFGAVDWRATVWIDGKQVADHEGGYSPFEIEVTDLLKPGKSSRLTVRAFDVTDPETPTGKQTGWYTPSGGIWQSVYIEYRGKTYVKSAHLTPNIDKSTVDCDCVVEAPAPGNYELSINAIYGAQRFTVKQDVHCAPGANPVHLSLYISKPQLWTPDSPTLYNTRILLNQGKDVVDQVETYFGMRKISRGGYGGSDHEYILLNNKPIYLRGALHQSFHPKGLYSYPDDAAMRADYAKAKELGLNFIRIHIKVDEPRALYWADRLGVLLMCDMPCFNKNTPRSHELWEQTLRATIDRDFNHPSIMAWCDFNETWGIRDGGYGPDTQKWVLDMFSLTKSLDSTRLAEDNSPCKYDHVKTDINSWHFYIDDYAKAAEHVAKVVENTKSGSDFNYVPGYKQDTAPLINSEYGGLSARGGDRDVAWPFLFLTNLLRKYDKIGGYVYTELEDIEWEHNGFLNYDRSPKDFNYPAGITLPQLQNEEFPVLDCPPYQRVDPFAKVSIPVLLSHWSEETGLKLRVSAFGSTVSGQPWSDWFKPVVKDVDAKPYAVTPQCVYEVPLPGATGLLLVLAEVMRGDVRVAANYCVIDARGVDWYKPDQYGAPFSVNAYNTFGFASGADLDNPLSGKIYGYGPGYIEYKLKTPMRLKADKVAGCRLMVEMASKAKDERLDWPAKKSPEDYPQTDGKLWPSDIVVSLNGVPCYQATIQNDYADALGVLSHIAGKERGSRGETLEIPIKDAAFEALKAALGSDRLVTLRFEVKQDAKNLGGLSLYGADMGATPCDPALVFDLAPGVKKIGSKTKVIPHKPEKVKKEAAPAQNAAPKQ